MEKVCDARINAGPKACKDCGMCKDTTTSSIRYHEDEGGVCELLTAFIGVCD